ncbi:MAG TPA: HAD hydrolase-like protein [Ktedonobacterales bacterium]|jgi:phosphoglycolate phosphatase-like HAD superfamily hydrolase
MLFLFDIDGTLLRGMPPAHRMALCDAAEQVYGVAVEPRHLGKTAGMTDSAIARRMLLQVGVSLDALSHGLPAFFAAAAEAYERHVPDDLCPFLTPHTTAALEWLCGNQAVLGLVTGNIERIAWRKLAAAQLDGYFSFGAFGDEAELRDELPPQAIARAEHTTARQFALDEVFVVGDTPADIACGLASHIRTIAVATGPEHSLEDLRACQPDYIFPDLSGLLDAPLFGHTGTSNRAI